MAGRPCGPQGEALAPVPVFAATEHSDAHLTFEVAAWGVSLDFSSALCARGTLASCVKHLILGVSPFSPILLRERRPCPLRRAPWLAFRCSRWMPGFASRCQWKGSQTYHDCRTQATVRCVLVGVGKSNLPRLPNARHQQFPGGGYPSPSTTLTLFPEAAFPPLRSAHTLPEAAVAAPPKAVQTLPRSLRQSVLCSGRTLEYPASTPRNTIGSGAHARCPACHPGTALLSCCLVSDPH